MTSRPVRILVVDEEEPLTDIVSMTLGLEGWDVAVARDGASAFDLIASGAPDIVLMDVTLPDMRGTEVVAALRAEGNAVPVVFLTGRASLEDRMDGFAAGGDDYVTKPFSLDELVDRLNPVVRRLGLAPSSRRYADLVLDEVTAEVWRADERVVLTPMEVEMLRALLDQPGTTLSLGQVLRAVMVRGVRIPREIGVRMLERMRSAVNAGQPPLVHVDARDGWFLAAA
ncbi:DNA-binding response OmpR family regulator [Salinibacterium sp. CAN_S4]|uniref:response regulator transcription factor n=1 Tax=Salinibacterium sp. CAN_S4 TaxID=2787727 RepID=UPI0018EF7871